MRDTLQKVCKKYETPDSDFHIATAESREDLGNLQEILQDIEKQKQLVSNCCRPCTCTLLTKNIECYIQWAAYFQHFVKQNIDLSSQINLFARVKH